MLSCIVERWVIYATKAYKHIYYWNYLEKLKDWRCCRKTSQLEYEQKNKIYWSQPHTVDRAQRSGWQWEISFHDEATCIIEKEDTDVDAIIKRVNSYWHSYRLEEPYVDLNVFVVIAEE